MYLQRDDLERVVRKIRQIHRKFLTAADLSVKSEQQLKMMTNEGGSTAGSENSIQGRVNVYQFQNKSAHLLRLLMGRSGAFIQHFGNESV